MWRREFLGALSGLALSRRRGIRNWRLSAFLPGGTLNPQDIRKYVTPLFRLPAMPQSMVQAPGTARNVDYYEVAFRQFRQQVLPAGLPSTTVWGYGSDESPETFHAPAYTFEARWKQPVRVRWINGFVDSSGHYLSHLLTVDPTLHWANPPGMGGGRDTKPAFTATPEPYLGPIPEVTHLHGAHTDEHSDGYPEAWYLPAANNIPGSYFQVGSFYDQFRQEFADQYGVGWAPGTATFQYQNDQDATTLWYHAHSLGITRLNMYAGLAGLYLLRGGPADVPGALLPRGNREISMVVQDRSFNTDGSLFYPDSRAFFDGFTGPYVPFSDVAPFWNSEFFANTMMVNGNTWPVLAVEPCRHRFRILNACNSRFVILKIAADPLASRPVTPALPFSQIGADGGFLPRAVEQDQLLIAPSERRDVIVDFTGLPTGTELYLINEGPDEPFGGGLVGSDFVPADPSTTGQVMKLVVVPLTARDTSLRPQELPLPARRDLGPVDYVRKLSLNELDSAALPGVGPTMSALGIVNAAGEPEVGVWGDPLTEAPRVGTTEIWELHNFTEDAHPIHIHIVQFQVVDRQPFEGAPYPPEPSETGLKDVVIAYPQEITRFKAHFDLRGLAIWHCHILEHEDNEMMRPYRVVAP